MTNTQLPDHSNVFKEVFSSGRKIHYKKGEIIQHANETPTGVYFLYTGFVREFTLTYDGDEHLTFIYEPGDLFSVNWMFLNINPNVFRQAHTDTTVYLLSEADFKLALTENNQFNVAVLHFKMKHVHLLSSRVENLTFNSAYDKVAYNLIHLAGRFGEQRKDGWYIKIPYRHQHMAQALSMSRETASRMISRMEQKGLVRQDGKGHFIISNPSALASTIGVEDVLGMWPNLADISSDKNH